MQVRNYTISLKLGVLWGWCGHNIDEMGILDVYFC